MTTASLTVYPDAIAALAVSSAVRRGAEEAAEDILRASQTLVPVRTGQLKSSGHIERGEFVAVVYDTDYASYVEFGTVDTPTFAYLRRGAEMAGYQL